VKTLVLLAAVLPAAAAAVPIASSGFVGAEDPLAEIAAVNGTSFSDTGLSPNASYSYRVRATDAAGNLGPYSNVASATLFF